MEFSLFPCAERVFDLSAVGRYFFLFLSLVRDQRRRYFLGLSRGCDLFLRVKEFRLVFVFT